MSHTDFQMVSTNHQTKYYNFKVGWCLQSLQFSIIMKEMRSGCFTLVANIFAPSLRNQSSKTVLEKQKLFIVKCEYNNLFFYCPVRKNK